MRPPASSCCRGKGGSKPVTDLADLADKKIRVFNKSMIDIVRGIGALPVDISFA